jgi:hypothetical protein
MGTEKLERCEIMSPLKKRVREETIITTMVASRATSFEPV